MDPFPIVLLLLLCVLIFAGSILGLIAFSATRRVEFTLKTFPLNELTQRIYKLEQQIAQLQKAASMNRSPGPTEQAPPPVAAPSVSPTPAAVLEEPTRVQDAPRTTASAPRAPSASRPRELTLPPRVSLSSPSHEPSAADLEALIGGRWFNRIGIIALLFAVSYFLKLAFDNNWIGPSGRVAIGILLGMLMLPWSEWLLRRDYTYFSEGIAGLGEATLFVSVWAGCQYYTLFTRQMGFTALVLITVVMAFLALRRDSSRIAFLSLLGGLLTPALMSSGKNEQVMLFSYLLCLAAAVLVVSWRRNWQSLLPLALGGAILYFWQWHDMFYSRTPFLERTMLFASLFFALYSAIPVIRVALRVELTSIDLLVVVANAVAYSAALLVMLWPQDRGILTLFFVLLAAFHAAIAVMLSGTDSGSSFPRFLYLGLAVAFITVAIPARFDENTVTLLFAVEGGALAWLGWRYGGGLLRPAGYLLLFLAAFRLLAHPPPADVFLWNERFFSYLVLVGGFVAPLWAVVSDRQNSQLGDTHGISLPGDRGARSNSQSEAEIAFLSVSANFFLLLALTFEFWDFAGRGIVSRDHTLAQNLSISILWTCYAAALSVWGVLRKSALLRWQSLMLLGLVVAKVFFIDLSSLDRVYRVLSFFILGSALLAVSFLYQRNQSRKRRT